MGFDHLDALAILDCCHAAATRGQSERRVVKVPSACGPGEQARSRRTGISLILRIGRAARALRERGRTVISLEELFQQIQQDRGLAPMAVLGPSWRQPASHFSREATTIISRICSAPSNDSSHRGIQAPNRLVPFHRVRRLPHFRQGP